MNPFLSVGLYLLMLLLVLTLIVKCLRKTPFSWSRTGGRKRCLAIIVPYFALALMPVAGAHLPDSRVKFALQAAGNIFLGFYLYFSGLLLVLSLIVVICGRISRKNKRSLNAGILILSAAAGLCLMAYGMVHARQTKVTDYNITIEKNAGEITDMKVVLIADLHLSVNSRLSTTQRMVELVNAEEPDVIVVAGDIFTSTYEGLKEPEKYAAALRNLQARYGVYAGYGNHDAEEGLFGGFPVTPISQAFRTKEMEQFFADCGFTVLYDETALLADGAVQLVGRVDGEKAGDGTAERMSAAEVLNGIDPAKPVLVLQHEPVEFRALKENGADLAMCGHTHAGQVFPGNLIVPFFNENAYGYKNVSGLDTVVTSGVGYYGPPMRVGTDSEITVINLHFAGDAQ